MIGMELIRIDDRERGLEYMERALALDPDDAGTLYNVACGYAIAGRPDRALDVLERAIEKGSVNLAWTTHDPDWDGMRDHPRFKALLERMR
jgi:adenylate cyclase